MEVNELESSIFNRLTLFLKFLTYGTLLLTLKSLVLGRI